MTMILIDGIKAVTIRNGVVRIDCIEGGANNEERFSGTLLVPANMVRQVVAGLTQALQQLDTQLREQQQAANTVGNA